jgi:hypothetical protein
MQGKTAMELIDDILLVPSHLRKSWGITSNRDVLADVIYLNVNTFKNIDLLIEVLYHELEHCYVEKATCSSITTKQEATKLSKFKCLEFVHSNPAFTLQQFDTYILMKMGEKQKQMNHLEQALLTGRNQ